MNVEQVKTTTPEVKDKLESIFEKQRSLMEKYEKIEASNGLLQTPDIPVNLHDNKGQARLKDFFWRATEEIAEAWEAFTQGDDTHFREELADALHFLIEACILAGLTPEFVSFSCQPMLPNEDKLDYMFATVLESPQLDTIMDTIMALGLAANCLKNKPWKQSHMKTDESKFKDLMRAAFKAFIRLCKTVGFTPQSLFDMYFKKNEVNKFRQETNY